MLRRLRKLTGRARRAFRRWQNRSLERLRGTAYWEERARQHGRRAVLNLAHSDEEYDAVTRTQRQRLLPVLGQHLLGNERIALDFGSGPGRFTPDLAALVGQAVGVDPIQSLLDLAPTAENVSYRQLVGGRVPFEDHSFDVVWVCLVLGGLDPVTVEAAALELQRVLRPGGLLFLVENTANKPSGKHWHFRSFEEYQALFPAIQLSQVDEYQDIGEPIAVMVGRSHAGGM